MTKKETLLKKIEELKKEVEEIDKEEVNYWRYVGTTKEGFKFGYIYKEQSDGRVSSDAIDGIKTSCIFLGKDFTPVEKPKEDEEYWSIDSYGCVFKNYYINNYHWKSGNLFNSKEEAIKFRDEILKRDI